MDTNAYNTFLESLFSIFWELNTTSIESLSDKINSPISVKLSSIKSWISVILHKYEHKLKPILRKIIIKINSIYERLFSFPSTPASAWPFLRCLAHSIGAAHSAMLIAPHRQWNSIEVCCKRSLQRNHQRPHLGHQIVRNQKLLQWLLMAYV